MSALPPRSPRHWPTWLGVALGVFLARWPWALQRRVGPPLGRLLQRLLRKRRRAAAINLALCFPELDDAAREALLRRHFEALGMAVFEFLRAWWGDLRAVESHYRVSGLEHVEALRASGRGVLLVSCHFTTLELCMRLMCRHLPVAGMYRPHRQPVMEWAVKRGRMRYAAGMFTREELRPAIRHLKQGGILWFAPDQETKGGHSVWAPFFGRPAWSLTSTHQLARLSGAAVLPMFHRRLPDGSYELEVGAPLEDFPGNDETADTARIMALFETLIRRAPEQYLWVHQRFKRQADGGPNPYSD
ncbi:MAG TPA: LpxL/LpxP family Kdo(2)-lipid IV(A) lauroyl/palmitoleoyl acyltransferase [Arenimonas sp.]|nr:LpxL/LpxP family Kdo(2)-lipid IV(A) lauroyl/palmitoleoyl acyltransferase [Arenimonas sp.]